MYLVTGGAGFIGSNLVHALVARGAAVRVLDNFATGLRENLAGLEGRIDLVEGDIRDLETCRKAVAGVRFVLHQATLPSVPRSIKDPIGSSAVNIQGTLNLLVAAAEHPGVASGAPRDGPPGLRGGLLRVERVSGLAHHQAI